MQTKTSNFEILMDMIRESVHECYEDEANTIKIEITEEGFRDILQGQQEEVSRNGKCLPIDTNIIQQVIEKCDEAMKHEEDRCERAHTASVCILKQLKQFELID
uniref:Uncharacterized protein n=1 Tax=Glossina morsitans morsitans TaxID=37546 RepID=A0A1B0FND2_GLOMM